MKGGTALWKPCIHPPPAWGFQGGEPVRREKYVRFPCRCPLGGQVSSEDAAKHHFGSSQCSAGPVLEASGGQMPLKLTTTTLHGRKELCLREWSAHVLPDVLALIKQKPKPLPIRKF